MVETRGLPRMQAGSLRTWLVVRFVGKNASAAVATDVWLYGLEGHNGLKGRPQTRPGDCIWKQLITTINNNIVEERPPRTRRNNWEQQFGRTPEEKRRKGGNA